MAAHLVRNVDGFGLDTSIECASLEWPCFGVQVEKKREDSVLISLHRKKEGYRKKNGQGCKVGSIRVEMAFLGIVHVCTKTHTN